MRRGLDDVTAPDCIDVPRWVSDDPQWRTVTSSKLFQVFSENAYTAMVASMLDHPAFFLRLDTAARVLDMRAQFQHTFWTGPAEEVFDADLGYLPYRRLDFETLCVEGD
jgi:UDP-galactopyranose mutase